MLKYNSNLKKFSRKLRTNQTPAERKLWKYIRRNQINNLRFTRQKPIGKYIADFYCHKLKLVIEIDGDRHFKNKEPEKDKIKKESYRLFGWRLKSLKKERFKKPHQLPFKKGERTVD
jgi:very-short-patch-repair endonuclease